MSIRFDCPHCKAHYDVADDLGGKMIMCRVCQKRAPVKSLSAAAGAAAALPSVAKTGAPSRRNFLMIGGFIAASVAASATGVLLARTQPWRHWGGPPTEGGDGGPGGRRRRGPPPDGAPPGGPRPEGAPPAPPPNPPPSS